MKSDLNFKNYSLVLCVFFIHIIQAQIYVDASATSGADDGSSWADAYTDLQDAINAASSGDDIWVAAGTYKPSAYPTGCTFGCSSSRDYTFQLKDGVNFYGGFNGTEVQLCQRDFKHNITVLSGDIGTLGVDSDNVYHVVLAAFSNSDPSTRLDGFSITGANANGSGSVFVNGQNINKASGGGIYLRGGTHLITNNSITENAVLSNGGGIYANLSNYTLIDNIISGNYSDFQGGGVFNSSSVTSKIINNTFLGNEANDRGGGVANCCTMSSNTLVNNTFSGNTSPNGGGIFLANIGNGTVLNNNIIWGNNTGIFSLNAPHPALVVVNDNIIQGGFPIGTNNINSDPLFITQPPVGLGISGDLRLSDGSPAKDAGDNLAYQNASGTPPEDDKDLDGRLRLFGNSIDFGAYEYFECPPSNILYVDKNATGANNGYSWGDAYTDLQKAFENKCSNITEIWVAAGTYKPSAYPECCDGCSSDRDFTFQLKDGISLYGGFEGTEINLIDRDIDANPTILSGEIGSPTLGTDNIKHVVLASFSDTLATTRLDGFSITDGNTGGVGSITVNGNFIILIYGAAIHTFLGTNIIVNNKIFGNLGGSGAGIYAIHGNNTITKNRFFDNTATSGAGIYCRDGQSVITNNEILGNLSAYGGGIYIIEGNQTLINNTITGNSALDGGGIYLHNGDDFKLINNTIAGNLASNDGGGIYLSFGNNNFSFNNIVWGNSSGVSTNGYNFLATHSIIQDGLYPGIGNLNVDPLFIDPLLPAQNTGGDYRLQACSPAIESGSNNDYQIATGINPASDTDLDGNNRLDDVDIDMGAYEYQNNSTWTGVTNNDFSNPGNWSVASSPNSNTVVVIDNISQNTPRINVANVGEVKALCIRSTGILEVDGTLRIDEKLDNNGLLNFNSNTGFTGQLDEFTGVYSGTGTENVERYVPKSNRAFRYISSPVNTFGSINQNLQEGATTADSIPNPNPGFGTHITGGSVSDGFDQTQTSNSSMWAWNVAGQNWQAVTQTKPKTMQVGEAYALMIRGDRSTTLSSNTAVGPETTLRFSGNIHTGDYPVPTSDLAANEGDFSLVANPYQAIVNLKTLLESGDAQGLDSQTVYVYDPTLGSKGGYATIDLSLLDPTSTPYDSGISGSTNADENLLPNQAFFVETILANPSLTFKETYKNTDGNFVDTFSEGDELSEIHINLKRLPEVLLTDGVSLRFDDNYSNDVNNEDAIKFWNYDEHVAILNTDAYLAIEKRQPPQAQDEIPLYTNNYQVTDYLWQISIGNVNQDVFLYDAYLETETPLQADDITDVSFSVDTNIAESIDPWRFSLRFGNASLSNSDIDFTNLNIYPNPITDYSFKISGLNIQKDTVIKIYDMLGRLVFEKTLSISDNTITIDLNKTIQSGLYQLLIRQDDMEHNSKLILKN